MSKNLQLLKSKWHHHLPSTVFGMENVVWHTINFADRQLLKKVRGGVAIFFGLHQHDLVLDGGCYKDYEYSRKCSSTETAPHVTLPTLPQPLIHTSSRLYIKSIGHQNIQSSLSLHRWYGHPESHTTGNTTSFFWPWLFQSFSSMHVGLWWVSKIFEGVLKENIKSS